jgi:hypothetical protein
VDLALDELGLFAIGMSLHGAKVAQIRTKVRHGHCAQLCSMVGVGSSNWQQQQQQQQQPKKGAQIFRT